MVKRMKLGSPELQAVTEDRKFKRKRAKLKEAAAKELADIQLEARKHTADILEKMVEIATSETAVENARIQAAHFVFDRAYGKAAQTNINANVNTNGKASELPGSALDKRAAALIKRIEELTGGGEAPAASEKRPGDVRVSDRDPNGPTRH